MINSLILRRKWHYYFLLRKKRKKSSCLIVLNTLKKDINMNIIKKEFSKYIQMTIILEYTK